ncbi:MAG: hypothetical protein ACP5O8_03005 [Candidatus Aenigmatarchaeota archaeon]
MAYAAYTFGAEVMKSISGVLTSILAILSLSCFLLFIVCFIFLARKWKKRFEKYGGSF